MGVAARVAVVRVSHTSDTVQHDSSQPTRLEGGLLQLEHDEPVDARDDHHDKQRVRHGVADPRHGFDQR